jgi:hypothetical protein
MPVGRLQNSTNVRFILPLIAVLGAYGCAAARVAPISASMCDRGTVAVCERHGAEGRCECVQRRALRESLDRPGVPTWLGPFGAPSSN